MIHLDLDQLATFAPLGFGRAPLDIKLPLADAFVLDGHLYDSLTFQPAAPADLAEMVDAGGDELRWLAIVARMAEVPLSAALALSDADAGRAVLTIGAQAKRCAR